MDMYANPSEPGHPSMPVSVPVSRLHARSLRLSVCFQKPASASTRAEHPLPLPARINAQSAGT